MRKWTFVSLGVLVALAACGGDDDRGPSRPKVKVEELLNNGLTAEQLDALAAEHTPTDSEAALALIYIGSLFEAMNTGVRDDDMAELEAHVAALADNWPSLFEDPYVGTATQALTFTGGVPEGGCNASCTPLYDVGAAIKDCVDARSHLNNLRTKDAQQLIDAWKKYSELRDSTLTSAYSPIKLIGLFLQDTDWLSGALAVSGPALAIARLVVAGTAVTGGVYTIAALSAIQAIGSCANGFAKLALDNQQCVAWKQDYCDLPTGCILDGEYAASFRPTNGCTLEVPRNTEQFSLVSGQHSERVPCYFDNQQLGYLGGNAWYMFCNPGDPIKTCQGALNTSTDDGYACRFQVHAVRVGD